MAGSNKPFQKTNYSFSIENIDNLINSDPNNKIMIDFVNNYVDALVICWNNLREHVNDRKITEDLKNLHWLFSINNSIENDNVDEMIVEFEKVMHEKEDKIQSKMLDYYIKFANENKNLNIFKLISSRKNKSNDVSMALNCTIMIRQYSIIHNKATHFEGNDKNNEDVIVKNAIKSIIIKSIKKHVENNELCRNIIFLLGKLKHPNVIKLCNILLNNIDIISENNLDIISNKNINFCTSKSIKLLNMFYEHKLILELLEIDEPDYDTILSIGHKHGLVVPNSETFPLAIFIDTLYAQGGGNIPTANVVNYVPDGYGGAFAFKFKNNEYHITNLKLKRNEVLISEFTCVNSIEDSDTQCDGHNHICIDAHKMSLEKEDLKLVVFFNGIFTFRALLPSTNYFDYLKKV